MKRLTLDQTWEQCLAMWKWISRQCKGKSTGWCNDNVFSLKADWLEKNDIREGELGQECFFCHRTSPKDIDNYHCDKCPGRKVDPNFYCMDIEHHFDKHPRLFYAELKRLNKVRLAK